MEQEQVEEGSRSAGSYLLIAIVVVIFIVVVVFIVFELSIVFVELELSVLVSVRQAQEVEGLEEEEAEVAREVPALQGRQEQAALGGGGPEEG